MIRTKLTEMLGIEYPIVQGCMQWISRAPLVAAVSETAGRRRVGGRRPGAAVVEHVFLGR